MRMTGEFQNVIQFLSKNFYVPDILLPTSSCIFILESPHIEELTYGAPVSGNSGRTMSKHIFGAEYGKQALGRIVKNNAMDKLNCPRLNGIGLLNVSNVPLQTTAYGKQPFSEEINPWLAAMGNVRTNNQKDTFASPLEQAVQTYFVSNLQAKLQQLTDQTITLVPCGRFAQKFVRLANVHGENWTMIDDVPHPSYNSWDRFQYRSQVDAVVACVTAAATDMPDGHIAEV